MKKEEAIKILKDFHDESAIFSVRTALETLHPEFRESEDERTRREIMEYITHYKDSLDDDEYRTWITWLEKQKPICLLDNSESNVKFPFKAKVKSNGKIVTIHGGQLSMDCKEWIKYQSDAEDGYMVYKPEDLELVCNIEQKPIDMVEPEFKVGDWITDGCFYCKISDVLDDRYIIENEVAQNSAILFKDRERWHLWAIQDAMDGDVLIYSKTNFPFIFNGKIEYNKTGNPKDDFIGAHCGINGKNKFEVNHEDYWTDNNVQPATKEQRDLLFSKMKEAGYAFDFEKKELKRIEEKNLTDFENAMMHIGESFFGKNAGLDPNDTNVIKEQAELLLELAPKQEWSEEDEEHIESIIERLDGMCKKGATFTVTKFAVNQDMDWLKTLKEKNTWKPKAWEIQILESVIEKGENPKNYSATLHGILEQLKKLKG